MISPEQNKKMGQSNSISNMHILVVDDEPLLRDMISSSLKSIDYKVSIANNGLEALCLLAEKDFDMVLMDIRMPVMDGLSATKFLRRCEQGKHHSLTEHHELAQSLYSQRKETRIPIIAVTGNIGDREILMQAGMDDFISKPFDLNRLYAVLDQFCKKSKEDIPAERRKHPRHALKDNTIVVFSDNIGQVVDISSSGLAIKYSNHEPIPNKWSASFFNKIKKTSIADVPLKLARKGEMRSFSTLGLKSQTIGVIFNNPDASQQDKINRFLYDLS